MGKEVGGGREGRDREKKRELGRKRSCLGVKKKTSR